LRRFGIRRSFRGRSLGRPRFPWWLNRLFNRNSRCAVGAGGLGLPTPGCAAEDPAEFLGDIFIDRTGVSLLLFNAQLWQFIQQLMSLYFQLPSQDVNPNLIHR